MTGPTRPLCAAAQDVRRHQDGQIAHVIFFGCAAERGKARQFAKSWRAAHCVRLLAGQITHYQRTGSIAQDDVRCVARLVSTGKPLRLEP